MIIEEKNFSFSVIFEILTAVNIELRGRVEVGLPRAYCWLLAWLTLPPYG
jgi:hypothetical protein